jgi:hypothetical protein
MSHDLLRVTPADLDSAAAQVRSMARSLAEDLASLRPLADGIAPPDPWPAPTLAQDARQVSAASVEVCAAVARLIRGLSAALDGLAVALARAGGGYRCVEDRLRAAAQQPERRHE